MKKINPKIKTYVEEKIFPMYEKNEDAHGVEHIKSVIEKSLDIAKNMEVNIDMVYIIAAYHDLGHYIDRSIHEIISSQFFVEDKKIKKFLNQDQIKIIKEAIEDHRATLGREPRSIYGKIVSTADRRIVDTDVLIKTSYIYGMNNYSGISEEEQKERIYDFLKKKYGEGGYAKIYLEDKEYEDSINEFRNKLSNKEAFMNKITEVVNNIKNEQKEN